MGDALAVVLLTQHHFTKEQFGIFHPGGALGKKLLLTVDDVMHKGQDNPVVSEDSIVQDALFLMTEKAWVPYPSSMKKASSSAWSLTATSAAAWKRAPISSSGLSMP